MDRKCESSASPPKSGTREGDIYKIVTTFGKTFALRYGYYEESDRKWDELDILYPDFRQTPLYTDDGEPFVTLIQDACERFGGKMRRRSDSTCAECKYMKRGEEWFGICTCKARKTTETP